MYSVFIKEVNYFLNTLIAYIVISVFLTAIGLLMWVFPDTSVLSYGYSDMETLFSFGPYVFMFLIPAITMRMFAEESKNGTLELLFTRPLTNPSLLLHDIPTWQPCRQYRHAWRHWLLYRHCATWGCIYCNRHFFFFHHLQSDHCIYCVSIYVFYIICRIFFPF